MNGLWVDTLRAVCALAGFLLGAYAVVKLLQNRLPRVAPPPGGAPAPQMRRLATLAIDPSRRVTLIDIDGARALVLSGGKSDALLPWPPAADLAWPPAAGPVSSPSSLP